MELMVCGRRKPRLSFLLTFLLPSLLFGPVSPAQAMVVLPSRTGPKPALEERTSRITETRAAVPIRFKGKDERGWEVAETANFRIYHNQSAALVNKVARVAEQTRESAQRRWLGAGSGETWDPPCHLYLHASKKDYWQIKAISGRALGHATVRAQGDQIYSRHIEVFFGQADLLTTVLPHEVTHVVVGSYFGERRIPNWANEGMAMLAETPEETARNLLALKKLRSELFSMNILMQTESYPNDLSIALYYLQSLSLVDFLVSERGGQVFIRYLNDGIKDGYEAALRRHYGFRTYEELEQHWLGHAFGESRPTGDVVLERKSGGPYGLFTTRYPKAMIALRDSMAVLRSYSFSDSGKSA